jgi:hypothetical protein
LIGAHWKCPNWATSMSEQYPEWVCFEALKRRFKVFISMNHVPQ